YIPGDEVRDIDWKATARHGSPLIRRYVAVRRQTVLLVTDTGRNMAVAARSGETKKDIAVMALGVMGYLAHRHGDVVGLVSGDSAGTTALPAKGGEAHLERLLRRVDSAATLDAAPSRLEDQLDHVARTIKGRNLLFVVADEVAASPATSRLLRRLQAQHEILWLTVRDARLVPDEPLLPLDEVPDSYSVSGSYPLPAHLVRDPAVVSAYATAVAERDTGRKAMLRQVGITEGEVAGSRDVVSALFALLERHRRAG
ncbi:MAG: DUF58 domain-containing protein, partial [Arthrobacter sp.]|nr:DUF58 domain-containing protein [Arthrobacter sp.]